MKRNNWNIIFFILLGIHLVSLLFHQQTLETITKPLLMPAVAKYFTAAANQSRPTLRIFILLALLFSWGGDVLLMFQGQGSLYFLLGLSSFLVAHVFYILFFHLVKKQEKINSYFWTILVVAIYYSVLIALLNPWLGAMRLPVRVYGLVISFMLLLALHMFYLRDKTAGNSLAVGAILFVISDSILAVNKFYQPVPAAAILVMLTYGLAQFSIARGASLIAHERNARD